MTYRSDLEAAHARSAALEHQLADAERDKAELARKLAAAEVAPAREVVAVEPAMVRVPPSASGEVIGLALLALGGVLAVLDTNDLGAVTLGILAALAGTAVWLRARLTVIAADDEVVVLTGLQRPRILAPGTRGVRWPVVEHPARLCRHVPPIDLMIDEAYIQGGGGCDVRVRARVAVGFTAPRLTAAIERFLGRPAAEITRVAAETLEGAVRGATARHTRAEVTADPALLAASTRELVEPDLARLGLELVELQVDVVRR